MEGTKNNGTNMGEPNVHFKVGDPDLVRVGSLSSSPARQVKSGCLNLPILFERAGSFFPTPMFDSEILETEQWKSYFPQTHRRFQYALIYVLVACVVWAIYFGCFNQTAHHWPYFLVGTIILFIVVALVLGFTYTRHYEKLYLVTSVFVSVLICVAVLLTLIYTESDLSTFGAFTASVELLLMIYSVIPMPMIVTVIFGVMYSIVFEVFNLMQNHHMQEPVFIAGKILLHLCIHIMGVHIFTMRQVRQHSTFLKIGQSAIVRQDLEFEKQIKEKMIHSLMPPSVASQVMKSRADKDEEAAANDVQTKKRNSKTKTPGRGEIIFRTFNMNRMEDVSILFADIVGFTKMSSNKTAERLVGLLNDLFGRFDDLCTQTGCEKISTLGDCYYCVAGCPTPKADHAKCCVEMGLGMIEAIKQFDIDNNEEVNMRVGVHTGTVLCGIVGTRRFKFDVWSNDVILANNMESSGEPGRVHISETSLVFLKDEYEVEPGPDCEGKSLLAIAKILGFCPPTIFQTFLGLVFFEVTKTSD